MSSIKLNFSIERILLPDWPMPNANSGHQTQQEGGIIHPTKSLPPPILSNLGHLLHNSGKALGLAATVNKMGGTVIEDAGGKMMMQESMDEEKKRNQSGENPKPTKLATLQNNKKKLCSTNVNSTIGTNKNSDGQRANGQLFQCKICGKAYRHASSLCRHKIIHIEKKPLQNPQQNEPYSCKFCNKQFGRNYELKKHLHKNKIHQMSTTIKE